MIMDSLMKRRRFHLPKRTSELIALLAISSTLFLFLHTRDLSTQLQQMRGRLPLSANQLTGENSGNSIESGIAATLSQEANVYDRQLVSRPPVTPQSKIEYLPPSQLNNTQYADTDVVFFNRVPKVGSQTIMELLRRLSMINNFGFNRDNIQRVEYIRLAPPDQLQLALQVAAYEPPSVYIKHVCFTNFTQFGLPEPIYLNLVRDPVERVISWYYYVRAPWYYVERKQAFPDLPLPEPAWLKKDFESCVLNGDRECRYIEGERHEGIGDHRRQSLFFCGHEDECTPFNTVGALEKAKYAVERHYAVVGVLEDINATLTVLEHYIPKFFRGASNVYWSEVNNFVRINRNNFKPPVSEHVKDIVRRNFTREIEFYQFCRQRLHKQLYALKLPDTTTHH